MRKTKGLTVLALVLVLALAWTALALAQQNNDRRGDNQPRTERGNQAQTQDGRNRWDPQQMNQRRLEGIKTALQASDEEWTVLQPRVEKVLTLSRQASGNRMMMMGRAGGEGFGGGRRSDTRTDTGATPGRVAFQTSPVDKATSELQQLVSQSDASSGAIVAKLTALRQEKAKAKTELAAAQKSLREVLNARQEAQLVLMGLLE